jgi:two-component system C4-dicarboxylate transport sensor histidine kinase DctB
VTARIVGLEAWAMSFQTELHSARFWGRIVLVSSAATIVLVLLLQLEPARAFFRLSPELPLALVALRLVLYAAFIAFERRWGHRVGYFVLGSLGMGFTFQLVLSSLVVSAAAPGAFVLAVLPVVGAAYNTMILRATPRFPWPALVHAAAMALVLATHPTTPYVQIFAVAGVLAVSSGLFLGALAEEMAQARRLLEEHRRAIAASALEERSGEAQRLSSTLLEILQWNHDASSALSTAALDAEHLADLIRRDGTADRKTVHAAARTLRDALRRMAYDPADHARAQDDPSLGAAMVVPAIRSAFAEAARRAPAVAFEVRLVSRAAELAEATVRGGATELERTMAELAKNACEGSGEKGAARVVAEVDVGCEPGFVHVRVLDDGPGFAPVLGSVPVPLLTTKAGGSGIGLYTISGIAGASGGSLTLGNRPESGAVVTLRLPRR